MTGCELIVHIGQVKTGSTSIQHALSINAEAMLTGGFDALYPRSGRKHDAHFDLTGLAEHQRRGAKAANWLDLGEEIAASGARRAILSCEVFSTHPPGELAADIGALGLRDSAQLRLVCYIRPFASLLLSWYGHMVVRENERLDLRPFTLRFLDAPKWRAEGWGRWIDLFGRRIDFRLYDPRSPGDGVTRDFLRACFGADADLSGLAELDGRRNTGHGAVKVAMMARIRRRMDEDELRPPISAAARRVARLAEAGIDARFAALDAPLDWPRDLLEVFCKRLSQDAAQCDRMFWPGESHLRDDLARALDETPAHSAAFSLEEALGADSAEIERVALEVLAEAREKAAMELRP